MFKPVLSTITVCAFAVLAVCCSKSALAAELPAGGDINCTTPLRSEETGHDVLRRFGPKVRVAALTDTEGETGPGLMLYPDDPKLQLEIEVSNDTIRSKVSGINLTQKDSKWTMFGLRVGMTLDEVAKVNGGPLDLWGFGQFGRGGFYAVIGEFQPGKHAGNCKVQVMFSPIEHPVNIPESIYNQDHLAYDNPKLRKIAPVVSELWISWEQPLPE